MKPLLLGICLLAMSLQAHAASMEGVTLPYQIEVFGRKLILNGLGLREATIFQLDVYVAGLYLESKNKNEDDIIRSNQVKSIQMQFVRNISASTMRKSFIKSIKRNCEINCQTLFTTVTELGKRLPDIRDGDHMGYEFGPDYVRITFNGIEKGVIRGEENTRVVISSFIGHRPPDKEMKDGMLGRL